jgi:hypothetical protein
MTRDLPSQSGADAQEAPQPVKFRVGCLRVLLQARRHSFDEVDPLKRVPGGRVLI